MGSIKFMYMTPFYFAFLKARDKNSQSVKHKPKYRAERQRNATRSASAKSMPNQVSFSNKHTIPFHALFATLIKKGTRTLA